MFYYIYPLCFVTIDTKFFNLNNEHDETILRQWALLIDLDNTWTKDESVDEKFRMYAGVVRTYLQLFFTTLILDDENEKIYFLFLLKMKKMF